MEILEKMMKVAKFTNTREIQIFEEPVPELVHEEDVLVRIRQAGICGSDVHYYVKGEIAGNQLTYPATLGHECAGEVVAMGKGGERYLMPGMTVVIDPAISCTHCDQCRAGHPNRCRHLQFLGNPGEAPGCMAEYRVFPARNCIPVTPGITPEEVVMTEPLSVGLHALSLAGFFDADEYLSKLITAGLTFMPMDEAGKWIMQPAAASMRMVLKPFREKNLARRCVIFGAGPIGLGLLACAKLLGVMEVTVIDPLENRLNVARQYGASRVINPLHPESTHFVAGDPWKYEGVLPNKYFHFVPRAKTESAISFLQAKNPLGADVVFECSGDPACMELAAQLLAPGGTLVQVGIPRQDTISLDPHLLRRNEIRILNVRRQNFCFRPILDWITSRDLQPRPMQTHTFPLARIQDAFELLLAYSDGVIKAVIEL